MKSATGGAVPGATFPAGFTLLELLVALSIFALISAMAYGGLQSVMTQQQQTGARSERLADLQKVAKNPNVYCKVSGMVTEADWSGWKPT